MDNMSPQRRHSITPELVSNFARSIQSVHLDRTKRYLSMYGAQLLNKLQPKSRMPPFYHALQLADPPTSLQFMQELLKYRPNIHFRDSFGNTFLHHCCYFDNCSTFQLLAERGVDSSVKNIYGQSILFAIAKNNNQQILQYLIKQQQKSNQQGTIEVNDVDIYGRTPLFYAAEQGNIAICEILLKSGALVDIKDTLGHQAQFYAKKHGKNEVVALISSYRKAETPLNTQSLEELFTYTLSFLDEKYQTNTLTVDQVLQLVRDNPQLRNMFDNPQIIQETAEPPQDWREDAKRVLKKCLTQEGSEYFSEPVIQECFGITDYYQVIKHPMDFQTITKKLTYNGYKQKEELERDVQRIYENSVIYNGKEHLISQLAANIVEFFKSNWHQSHH